MVKIAVIEDIPVFQDELKNSLMLGFGGDGPDIDIFSNGESFLSSSYNGQPYEALFIDIELPGISGMDVAKTVRENGYAGMIVFTTSHEQFVYEGYEVEAFRYLLKPVKENDIKNCVKKLLDGKSKRSLVFSFNKKKYNIGFDEIVYISSYGHYITIHTEGNGYEWKYSLKELQKELPGQFVRCHRSFIVNLDHMRKIEGKRIQMKNGSVIDVAGGYLESVRKALSKLV